MKHSVHCLINSSHLHKKDHNDKNNNNNDNDDDDTDNNDNNNNDNDNNDNDNDDRNDPFVPPSRVVAFPTQSVHLHLLDQLVRSQHIVALACRQICVFLLLLCCEF